MVFLLEPSDDFPNPSDAANDEGLVAVGSDLSPENLLKAYRNGIFPWFNEGQPYLWWSPNPRMVLFLDHLYVSKSLRKTIRDKVFTIKMDTAFDDVIHSCAKTERFEQEGSWITKDIIDAYKQMHSLGYAHSVEAYSEGELVGGLYGLAIGKVFFGESMFHKAANASKVAFVHLVNFLQEHHFELVDAQQDTSHLRSLGASLLSREDFIEKIQTYTNYPSIQGKWTNLFLNHS